MSTIHQFSNLGRPVVSEVTIWLTDRPGVPARTSYPVTRAGDVTIPEQLPSDAREWVFRVLNGIVDPTRPTQVEALASWRAKGRRSLSVGDVVAIGESAWRCDIVGWTPVTLSESIDAGEAVVSS